MCVVRLQGNPLTCSNSWSTSHTIIMVITHPTRHDHYRNYLLRSDDTHHIPRWNNSLSTQLTNADKRPKKDRLLHRSTRELTSQLIPCITTTMSSSSSRERPLVHRNRKTIRLRVCLFNSLLPSEWGKKKKTPFPVNPCTKRRISHSLSLITCAVRTVPRRNVSSLLYRTSRTGTQPHISPQYAFGRHSMKVHLRTHHLPIFGWSCP